MKTDTFERLYEKCQDESFLSSEKNDYKIPFYIIPYEPQEEKTVSQQINMVTKRLREANKNILVLELFAVCIDLLKEQDLLDDIFDLEKDEDATYFLDAFDSALNDDIVTNYIQQSIQGSDPDVVFIQGVGRIYPFKKINPLINSLHSKTEGKPIVFFYPGVYDGNSFKLFGLHNDSKADLFKSNYYQAYNLE
jgi:hypothetical protein